jgi:hypothetical protein
VAELWRKQRVAALTSCSSRRASEPALPQDASWRSSTAKTFAASQLETSMGDVYVYLPGGLPLTIDAAIDAAAGHHIVTDFPLNILGDKENFSERTISGHGTLNGGGEVLRIRTVAGNIEIRKLDSRGLEDLKSNVRSTIQSWQTLPRDLKR